MFASPDDPGEYWCDRSLHLARSEPAKFHLTAGIETNVGSSGISTSLKIQVGQMLVLGKVKNDPDRNTDVFLVVTFKLH